LQFANQQSQNPRVVIRNLACKDNLAMDPLTAVAAAGMRARMESLDLLANNIANSSTQGYKADRESYTTYLGSDARPGETGSVSLSPFAMRSWVDLTQGALQPTGDPLNVALSGRGFLVAESPKGPLFTRNGSLQISAKGVLLGPEGYPLRGANGSPVRLDPTRPFEIAKDGSVTQNGVTVGKLAVVKFSKASGLMKQGANYLINTDPNDKPLPAPEVEIHQGKIENSNVTPAEAAVRLVSVLRHFEMLQKAIALGAEMNRKGMEDVAKVGP